jgi:hypothetical protein
VTVAVAMPPPPPLTVEILSVTPGFLTDSVTFRVTSGLTPVNVHLGLLPGTQRDRDPVYVFADPHYPDTYGSYTATHQVIERVQLVLAESGVALDIQYVDGNGLMSVVNGPAEGTLGIIPDAALSNTTAPLANWVTDGGTLVWAGGALGSQEGHPTNGPFSWDPLDWKGQTDLVHYPLTDVGVPGSLLGNRTSPTGAAFGTEYNGTPTGANTSALRAHGGVDLGIDSLPGPEGAAPRTSLAYQPVDYGGVFYFGGSFSAQTRPTPSDVPNADFSLSTDLAALLASEYVPGAGSGASANIQLATLASDTVTLTVPVGELASGLVALVTTPTLPTFLSVWSAEIQPPAGGAE